MTNRSPDSRVKLGKWLFISDFNADVGKGSRIPASLKPFLSTNLPFFFTILNEYFSLKSVLYRIKSSTAVIDYWTRCSRMAKQVRIKWFQNGKNQALMMQIQSLKMPKDILMLLRHILSWNVTHFETFCISASILRQSVLFVFLKEFTFWENLNLLICILHENFAQIRLSSTKAWMVKASHPVKKNKIRIKGNELIIRVVRSTLFQAETFKL